MRTRDLAWAAIGLVLPALAPAQPQGIQVTVSAGKHDYANVPIVVPLSVAKALADSTTAQLRHGVAHIDGQITAPGILAESHLSTGKDLLRRDLHFVLPRLKAGETVTLSCELGAPTPVPDPSFFVWEKPTGEHTDLHWAEQGVHRRPVLRYMHRPYDDATLEARNLSYKVFHHLWDPAGKRLVTNGGHNDDPNVNLKWYPHHRGVQMGWNKCLYHDGKVKADTWHCQKDDHQSHEGFVSVAAGMVLGRHRVAVDWHGPKKEVFAKEERELTVYATPGGRLVEFASRLKPTVGKVRLDGDPQHAGFQFRAHNDVFTKTKSQTYYLRPDGKDKPGATRNWDPKQKKGPINLPWDAMSFVLEGKRYTVCYLNHPKNPGESRWSERDYGRFGCYFEYELTEDRPLVVNYRLWLQDGEMTGEQVQALSEAFVAPPKVSVK